MQRDRPVEQPTKLEFMINLKTAKLLGIDPPPPLGTPVHPGHVEPQEQRYVGHPQADPHARRHAHGVYGIDPIAPTPNSRPDKDAVCLC